ncbi:MAG: hypothetical protein HQ536_02895 [Parcubacteria group bacterium]|nr:hypothetical protein [Parcubacteria group bacterium]
MNAKTISKKKPRWELQNILKALDSPVAAFLNTEEEKKRLFLVKAELSKRGSK